MQLVNGNMSTGNNDENYSSQLVVSRFRNLGKEKFQNYLNFEVNPIEFIKECTVNYAINLPQEINEFIISTDQVPLLWLSDLPLFAKVNEYLRREGMAKGDFTASLQEIKKFFSKWITTRSDKERQFYATTTFNLIEKDVNRYNFQKLIYKALLITFDKRISNAETAINSVLSAMEVINNYNLDAELRNELDYLISITLGCIYIKSGYIDDAAQIFESIGQIRPRGATGLLYRALMAKYNNDIHTCLDLLSNLLNQDLERFNYALNINKIEAFHFFLKHSYVYQIFKEERFADIYSELESLFDSFYSNESNIMYRISLMKSELEELRLRNYYTDDIIKQLDFINQFVDKFRNSNNQLVLRAATTVKEKLINVCHLILDTIKASKVADMSEKLTIYDYQLRDATNTINNLQQSGGRKKEVINEQLKEGIEILKEEYTAKIEHAKQLQKNLENSNKYDSGRSFSSAMFYNFVIALFIFVIGGIGSGMLSGSSGFNMQQFVMNGMKWGGISFVLGIFGAMFSAANTMSEKNNEKARLNRFLESIKLEQDAVMAKIREDNADKMEMFDQSYNSELRREESRLEKLRQEKDSKYKILNHRVENEMSEYRGKIDKIIKL